MIGADVMQLVLDKFEEKKTTSSVSDLSLEKVVEAIDAFSVPRLAYRSDRKQYGPYVLFPVCLACHFCVDT
jgi:hypothetical protein